jgi:hypothetical protein
VLKTMNGRKHLHSLKRMGLVLFRLLNCNIWDERYKNTLVCKSCEINLHPKIIESPEGYFS